MFVKSNIWEFHETLSAYCAGFGHKHTGSLTTSRDPRPLCSISSGSGSVKIRAKSGTVHRNDCLVLSITRFPASPMIYGHNQLSLRCAVRSQPADMPAAPTGSGNWSLSPRQGTFWAHSSSHRGILGPPFLAVGHTGSTAPNTGTFWDHSSSHRGILGPPFLAVGHTGSTAPNTGTFWAHSSSHRGILGPPHPILEHTEPTVPHTGTYWSHCSSQWRRTKHCNLTP